MEGRRGKRGGRRVCVLFLQSKNALFDECAGVRRCDVTGGLWVSRRVGFQGLGTPGEGGRKGPQMEEKGNPFSQPCHVTTGLVVGAALCVLVHGPAIQSRTGTVAQRLPWNCWRGCGPFVSAAAGVSDHLGGRALLLPTLLPLTALSHGGGSWGADGQGPATGAGGCGSCGRAGGLPVDNSGDPLHHLAGDHSPETEA